VRAFSCVKKWVKNGRNAVNADNAKNAENAENEAFLLKSQPKYQ
jgi:hypothetical protein